MKRVDQPLVSILIVPYNQEAYVGKALDSLLNQVCPFSYEILVGEDCSTDGTRAICQDYAARYSDKIRLYLNERNKGLIRNYFDLLKEARGFYLADCGADDYWIATDKLSRQVAVLEQHPEITMVCGNWQLLHQKSGTLTPNQLNLNQDWYDPERFGRKAIADYLNKRDYPLAVLSTACFRTSLLIDFMHCYPQLFSGEEVVCEDLPITLCLLSQGPIYFMKDDLMVYRMLENSASHSETLSGLQKGFFYKVFIQTLILADTLGITTQAIRPYTDKIVSEMVYFAFTTKDLHWQQQILCAARSFGVRFTRKQQVMARVIECKTFNRWAVLLYGLFNPQKRFHE